VDNSKIVFLINDQARAIMATYEPGAPAEMFKTLDDSISVNDLVVVQSTTRHMMTVVKVTAVDVDVNFDSTTPLKWIVPRSRRPVPPKVRRSLPCRLRNCGARRKNCARRCLPTTRKASRACRSPAGPLRLKSSNSRNGWRDLVPSPTGAPQANPCGFAY
jgi:hypothetical protein